MQKQRYVKAKQRYAKLNVWHISAVGNLMSSRKQPVGQKNCSRFMGLIQHNPSPALWKPCSSFIQTIAPRLIELVTQAISDRKAYERDLRIVRPNGSIRYVEVRGMPLFDDQGIYIRMVGTTLNITERKQAESASSERTTLSQCVRYDSRQHVFGVSKRAVFASECFAVSVARLQRSGVTFANGCKPNPS